MKWLKRLFLLLVVLVVLVFGAAAILLATLDPNDYKPMLVEEVKKATGRDLKIDGDISLTYFPWLGLRLGKVELGNAPGFGADPFGRVGDVQVRVALIPLFRGEIRADKVTLEGLRVNLAKNAEGKTNWDDLVESLSQAGEEAVEEQAPPPEAGTSQVPAVAIGGLVISDAAIRWQDAQAGTDVSIDPLDMETSELELGRPVDLDLRMRLSNAAPPVVADVKLTTEVHPDLDKQRVVLEDLELGISAEGDALPGDRAALSLSTRAELGLESQRYVLEGLKVTVKVEGKDLPGGRIQATLDSRMEADLVAGSARIAPLALAAFGVNMKGQVDVTGLQGDLRYSGEMSTGEFSPRAMLKNLGSPPPETADPKVLANADLEVSFSGKDNSASIDKLAMTLDDSKLTGEAAVNNFDKPAIRFKVVLDQMDADRYLPPAPKETGAKGEPAPGPATPSADDSLDLPIDTLRGLDVAGEARIGKLKIANVRLSDVSAVLNAKDGLLSLKPVSTALYDGRIDSGVIVDARPDTPAFQVNTSLKGVQLGGLLGDLTQEQSYVRGSAALSFDLKTQGQRVSTLKRQLGGNAKLAVNKGALHDPELARKVEAAVAFLQRRQPRPTGEELIFDSLTGSARIDKGVLDNRDLRLDMPLILVRGEGKADIAAETVDYTLKLSLTEGSADAKRVVVPITVKGPFASPSYGLDLEALARETVRQEAEKAISRGIEKAVPQQDIEKVLPGGMEKPLGDALKGIFGR
ncbi:MAG: AsmA family protein [Gammaproteobacteria bacterium]|jgi:AsmA protein|nr:AsmA family protein [Gammaproteobacteria bacterium]